MAQIFSKRHHHVSAREASTWQFEKLENRPEARLTMVVPHTSLLTSSPDHSQHLHSDYFSSNDQKALPRTRSTSSRITTKRIYHVQEESYQQASYVSVSSSDYRHLACNQRTHSSPSLPTYLPPPHYEIDAPYGGLRQSSRVSHHHALRPCALGPRMRGRFVLLRSW